MSAEMVSMNLTPYTISSDRSLTVFLSVAEHLIGEAQRQPGHPLEVLRLVASSDAAEISVRQAAAVHFKNLVKIGWDESKEVSQSLIHLQKKNVVPR